MATARRREGTAEKILDSAEDRLCRYGYNGVSFRDIAADVGVKSASVHYFFPTKPALVAAVARRYAEACLAELGDPAGRDPAEALEALAALFRRTVAEKKRMCLFGMMAAEVGALPTEVGAEARRFFAETLQWLRAALPAAEGEAEAILAGLEGGVLLARAMDDPTMLEKVVERLRASRSAATHIAAPHLATIGQPATTR
jgi:TetR/AcrR family transcriptional repressor of nem operon